MYSQTTPGGVYLRQSCHSDCVLNINYKNGAKKPLNINPSRIYPKHAPQPMKEEYILTGVLEPTNEPYAIAGIYNFNT